jgi:chromosome partitioning protein
LRWIDKRPNYRPLVNGIAGFDDCTSLDRIASDNPVSRQVIVDLPAAQTTEEIFDHVYDAHSILIPVVPSEIDIYAAAKFIADLLLFAQLDRRRGKLAIVANRVRKHTRSYAMLTRFLTSLDIPVIAHLRDSQNYVHAVSQGIGICEMPEHRVRNDIDQFETITGWLERWRSRELDALIAAEMKRDANRGTLSPAVGLQH